MSFYLFRQNNSGGAFEGPAIKVYIEASDAIEATMIAMTHGLYFDDDYDIDCACCGTRWSPAEEWDACAEPREPSAWDQKWSDIYNVPASIVILKNKED